MSIRKADIKEIQNKFNAEGLPVPRIPRELWRRIYTSYPWSYSSRKVLPASSYNIDWYVQELVEKQIEPYFLLEHAGHGINSRALHFFTVSKYVACFLQIPWGGGYMDKGTQAGEIRLVFSKYDEIMKLTVEKPGSGNRIVVYYSGFYGAKWGLQEIESPYTVEWLYRNECGENKKDNGLEVFEKVIEDLLSRESSYPENYTLFPEEEMYEKE
jgi:hypothetical protein